MSSKALLLAFAFLTGFCVVQSCYAKSTAQSENTEQSVMLDMQNMTCAMCKFTIKKALQGVDGVNKVNVDYDTKTASVSFDPQKTNSDALIKATTNAGYPSTVRQER